MAQTAKKSEPKLVDPDKISEVVSEPAPEIAVPQALEGEKVADTLIRARQQYGQDLRSIAQVLCIRYSYLDAIERANYENLPGATYAVGFVRTYAEFLGLDGDSIVERFKNEVQGLDGQTKLHFPTPAPEGKMPGGAVFLVAALLFAGAYGVWFYLSNKGETISDLVSPVPERLQELVTEEPTAEAPAAAVASVSPATAETETTAPAATSGSTTASVETAPEAPATTSPASEPTETATAEASASAPAEASASQAAPAAPEAAETVPSAADPVVSEDAPQQSASLPAAPADTAASSSAPANAAPQPAPVVTFEQPEPPLAAAPAPEASQSGETGDSALAAGSGQTTYAIPAAPANGQPSSFLLNQEPQVYGGDNTDARIVLKATQDAWVQVRDREGTLLLTRVLRVGDSYRVPNQEDLTLLTGNAGGLEIMIDGTPLAPLGPVGAVRRNVPLDPEQLLSGGAR